MKILTILNNWIMGPKPIEIVDLTAEQRFMFMAFSALNGKE